WDRKRGAVLHWPTGVPLVHEASYANRPRLYDSWDGYFYVPPGTATVAGYAAPSALPLLGTLVDASGATRVTFTGNSAMSFSVDIPSAQRTGGVWHFANSKGVRTLSTVPPWFARNPSELLL